MKSDKLDKALSILSTPDWISPASSIAGSMVNIRSTVLYIEGHGGFSVNAIKRILNNHAIKNWGGAYSYSDDWITINVLNSELEDAKRILKAEGVPLYHESGLNLFGCFWLIPIAGLVIWWMMG